MFALYTDLPPSRCCTVSHATSIVNHQGPEDWIIARMRAGSVVRTLPAFNKYGFCAKPCSQTALDAFSHVADYMGLSYRMSIPVCDGRDQAALR